MDWPTRYPPHTFAPDHATATGEDTDICLAPLKTASYEQDGYEMLVQCGLTRAEHP